MSLLRKEDNNTIGEFHLDMSSRKHNKGEVHPYFQADSKPLAKINEATIFKEIWWLTAMKRAEQKFILRRIF